MNRASRMFPKAALAMLVVPAWTACGEGAGTTPEQEQAATRAAAMTDRVSITPEALPRLGLEFARVQVVDLAPTLEAPAELVAVPDRLSDIGARMSGRVVEVLVNVGDRVRAGEPLLTLESTDVGQAWADLVAARAREDVTRRARDRQQLLIEGRVTAPRAFEEADAAYRVADAELRAAVTRLAVYGILEPGEPPADPGTVTLYSPIGGTITRREANGGAWVEPADVLLQVMDLDELWVQATVYEQQMRFVATGQSVQVEVRAFPGEVFEGTVARLDGTLDAKTRTVGVRIELPNRGHRLRPGMFASVRIQGTHAHEPRDLLAIPWSAVQEIDGHQAVFVSIGEGTFEVRAVHTGERAGDLVEILTGLTEGEQVVADGSFLLKGQLLRSTLAAEEG